MRNYFFCALIGLSIYLSLTLGTVKTTLQAVSRLFLVCYILGFGQAYKDWSVEETQSWLTKIGLDRELGPGFELHEYDGRALQVCKSLLNIKKN